MAVVLEGVLGDADQLHPALAGVVGGGEAVGGPVVAPPVVVVVVLLSRKKLGKMDQEC